MSVTTKRAYTYIGRGTARVGNQWLDRAWSTFVGATTGLIDRVGRLDWLSGRCDEFALMVNGEVRGVLDFGEIAWSEDNSPIGATLEARQKGPDLEIVVSTLAFHDHPALIRTVTILNCADSAFEVGPVALDSVSFRENGTEVRREQILAGEDGQVADMGNELLVATRGARGIVMGPGAECSLKASKAGPAVTANESREAPPSKSESLLKTGQADWAVVYDATRTIEPGGRWTLPAATVFAFEGAFNLAVQSAYTQFLRWYADTRGAKPDAPDPQDQGDIEPIEPMSEEPAPVEITGLAHGGHGVGHIGTRVCFAPYALPGDLVELHVERESRGVQWAELGQVLRPSPHRIEPVCPKFGECGGCTWLHFAYPAQADWKRRIVRDCFERIGKIEVDPGWDENADFRLGYRTRAEFHCDGERCGYYARSTRRVVDIESCPLCHPRLNEALARLRRLRMKGSVEVVVNPEGDERLVWSTRPYRKLRGWFPEAEWPRSKDPARTGRRARFLFDGVPVVNGAFVQSSLLLNRVLVQTAHAMIGDAKRILDLYCGNGNLSLGLASRARVLGLDHDWAAVRAAATQGNGEYRVCDERGFGNQMRAEPWDVIVLDPPRTGAKTITDPMAQCTAAAIVYVSCDPATLARDVNRLARDGWHVDRLTVVDMFPHTAHIETVCRLVHGTGAGSDAAPPNPEP